MWYDRNMTESTSKKFQPDAEVKPVTVQITFDPTSDQERTALNLLRTQAQSEHRSVKKQAKVILIRALIDVDPRSTNPGSANETQDRPEQVLFMPEPA